MGYQPNINCIHFYRERCSHPVAQRKLLANLPCVLGSLGDERCSACRYQVESQRPSPPASPTPTTEFVKRRPTIGGGQ